MYLDTHVHVIANYIHVHVCTCICWISLGNLHVHVHCTCMKLGTGELYQPIHWLPRDIRCSTQTGHHAVLSGHCTYMHIIYMHVHVHVHVYSSCKAETGQHDKCCPVSVLQLLWLKLLSNRHV